MRFQRKIKPNNICQNNMATREIQSNTKIVQTPNRNALTMPVLEANILSRKIVGTDGFYLTYTSLQKGMLQFVQKLPKITFIDKYRLTINNCISH